MPGLLVSVRSVPESEAALRGGADVIDVKEPRNGPLGQADFATIEQILRSLSGRRLVSAALGELEEWKEPVPPTLTDGLDFVKVGLHGQRGCPAWKRELPERLALSHFSLRQTIAVAYADAAAADSPPPEEIAEWAASSGVRGLLLDTYYKNGASLGHVISMQRLEALSRFCREKELLLTLAGSLNAVKIQALVSLRPDYFGVRGAACLKGARDNQVHEAKVRALKETLTALSSREWGLVTVPAGSPT